MNWRRLLGSKDTEIDEEIESHLKMAIQDRIDRGESPEKAHQAALREFGGATLIKQTTSDVWRWTLLDEAWQDLRFGLRILTQSPFLAAAVITLIALGIGGNTAIFSMVNAILLKPMPGVQAENLVLPVSIYRSGIDSPWFSYANYLDFAAQTKTLRNLAAHKPQEFALVFDRESYGLYGAMVTPNYFETLGVRLTKGRSFTETEGNASDLLAIISNRIWQEQFHGSDHVLGRTITLNGHAALVIGVAPPGFRGEQISTHDDVWVPIVSYSRIHGIEKEITDRGARRIEMVGQLSNGVSLRRARAEFDAISKRLQLAYPEDNENLAISLEPQSPAGLGARRLGIFSELMLVVATLSLLVACANVANLLLARAVIRQPEMAVRQSLGASRSRIFRMLLSEGVVLSLTGFVAAWIFTLWASQAIVRLMPTGSGMSLGLDYSPDWRVAIYGLGLTVVSTLAVTVAPTLRTWRQELLPWLKAGQQGIAQGRSRLSSVLVITQLALSVVLLSSAGLASRYLTDNPELGFNKSHLLLVTVQTTGIASTKEENALLLERMRERLRAVPGIVAASYAQLELPVNGSTMNVGPVRVGASTDPVRIEGNIVGPDYFRMLDVTLLAGRDFSAVDRAATRKVVLINQGLAQTLWPEQSAVGRTLYVGDLKEPMEVIGVTPNGAFSASAKRGFLFLPHWHSLMPPGSLTFYIRHTGNSDSIAPFVRAAIRETDVRIPIFLMRSMETKLQELARPTLMAVTLLSLFAGGALVLAAIGLYAVIAFNMSRRTRDFGVRIALGASSRQILRSVMKEGLLLTAIGLSAGFALSFAIAKALGSLIFGITPNDAPTYAGVFAVLAVVSLIACYLPARRAMRIDPVQALRND